MGLFSCWWPRELGAPARLWRERERLGKLSPSETEFTPSMRTALLRRGLVPAESMRICDGGGGGCDGECTAKAVAREIEARVIASALRGEPILRWKEDSNIRSLFGASVVANRFALQHIRGFISNEFVHFYYRYSRFGELMVRVAGPLRRTPSQG